MSCWDYAIQTLHQQHKSPGISQQLLNLTLKEHLCCWKSHHIRLHPIYASCGAGFVWYPHHTGHFIGLLKHKSAFRCGAAPSTMGKTLCKKLGAPMHKEDGKAWCKIHPFQAWTMAFPSTRKDTSSQFRNYFRNSFLTLENMWMYWIWGDVPTLCWHAQHSPVLSIDPDCFYRFPNYVSANLSSLADKQKCSVPRQADVGAGTVQEQCRNSWGCNRAGLALSSSVLFFSFPITAFPSPQNVQEKNSFSGKAFSTRKSVLWWEEKEKRQQCQYIHSHE